MLHNYSKLPERPQFIELHDELNVRENKKLNKLIPEVEKIYFSGRIIKINARGKPQKRILIITNRGLYNIHPRHTVASRFAYWFSPFSAVKRRIGASKIDSVTISTDPKSDQFVLHCKGEYDYLFDGVGKREKIVKALTQLYCPIFGDSFTVYMKEEANLREFRTTEDDFKAGVQKKPQEGNLQVSTDLLRGGLSWIIQNHLQFLQHSKFCQGSGQTSANGLESMHSLPETQSGTPSATMAQQYGFNQGSQTLFNPLQIPFIPYQDAFDRSKTIHTIDDIALTSSVRVQIQPRPLQAPQAKSTEQGMNEAQKLESKSLRKDTDINLAATFGDQIKEQNQNMSIIARV